MNIPPSKPSRRRFIALTAGSGAAVAAAVVAPTLTTKPATRVAAGKREGKGYQDTAHVRNYYRTTQV